MLSIGLTPESIKALDQLGKEVGRLEVELRLETEAEVAALAEALKERMAEQFKAGTDKHGRSHDKTGYSLSTLKLTLLGTSAVIKMGGGAVYVEYGTRPHVITASPGKTLHWVDEGGQDHFAKSVNHPGSAADDFVGRAIHDIEGMAAFAQVLEHFGFASFSTGPKGILNYREH